MRKSLWASSIIALTASMSGSIAKEAYEYGKKIGYRGSFDESKINDLFLKHEIHDIRIKNHKGLLLQGYFIAKENANKTLIVLHSFGQSSLNMEPYIDYFERLLENTNILLIDANAHGNSDGYIRGFGYRDVIDLMYWNTYILQRFGQDHTIIMYGKEMGANTILNAAGMNKLKNVKAIISEGAYGNVYHYLGYSFAKNTKTMHLVAPIIQRAIFDELHQDIRKMNTVKFVKKNNIPTLFVHSKDDQKVNFKNVLELYNHNASFKELFPIKEKYLYQIDESDEYSQTINHFIKDYIGG